MNRSLQEKSSARLAAAQLLYKAEMSGEKVKPEKLASEYEHYAAEENPKEAALPQVPASQKYLVALLSGVAEHQEALEPWLDQTLDRDWKKERMSPLLLAILRLGIFELAHHRNLSSGVIASEYTALAGRFFSEAETGFVNAALTRLASSIRE